MSIRDVARRAGVSPATVSKALNGTGSVSEQTQRRIEQAAAALGYQPNERARSFATRQSRRIAFLADFPFDAAFVNPHLFEIMRGVQHTLDKRGYSLTMKQATARQAIAYVEEAFAGRQVDGVVLHMSVVTKKLAAQVLSLGLAHVVIGKPDFESRLCWIDTDNCLSGELAARYLVKNGCREIAFVGGRPDDMTSWRRLLGVRNALRECGVELPGERVIQSNSTLPDGVRAARKLLRLRPQAVICANNPIALGVMQGLSERGVRVPQDMQLIAFDTYPFSLLTDPPMTVVDVNMYEMGQEAGRLVLRKIRHPDAHIQSYSTTPTLLCRGTTPAQWEET